MLEVLYATLNYLPYPTLHHPNPPQPTPTQIIDNPKTSSEP